MRACDSAATKRAHPERTVVAPCLREATHSHASVAKSTPSAAPPRELMMSRSAAQRVRRHGQLQARARIRPGAS